LKELGSNYFQTSDLGCSAALVTKRFTLISINKENPKRIVFIFDKERNIEKVVNEYCMDKLSVSARTFFNNLKMLKSRIYNF
jgi:hypothetical protein